MKDEEDVMGLLETVGTIFSLCLSTYISGVMLRQTLHQYTKRVQVLANAVVRRQISSKYHIMLEAIKNAMGQEVDDPSAILRATSGLPSLLNREPMKPSCASCEHAAQRAQWCFQPATFLEYEKVAANGPLAEKQFANPSVADTTEK